MNIAHRSFECTEKIEAEYDIEFAGKFLRNFLCFIRAATGIYEVCKAISSVIRFKHFTCIIFHFILFLRKGRGSGGGGSKKWGNENGR